jgi:aspartate aminotransferase-like enzyme
LKSIKNNQNAYTPAVSLIVGLREILRQIKDEGLENVFARTDRIARATRAAMKALGLKLLPRIPPVMPLLR